MAFKRRSETTCLPLMHGHLKSKVPNFTEKVWHSKQLNALTCLEIRTLQGSGGWASSTSLFVPWPQTGYRRLGHPPERTRTAKLKLRRKGWQSAGLSDWKVLFLFLFLACTCSFVLLLRVFASSESRSPRLVFVLGRMLSGYGMSTEHPTLYIRCQGSREV